MKNTICNFCIALLAINISFGQAWTFLNPIPQGNTLNCIRFVSENTGYAVGAGGAILKTINGGTTWSLLNTGNTSYIFNSVFFTDENSGCAVGITQSGGYGVIMKTINGGTSWVTFAPGYSPAYNSVCFTTTDTGYVVGDGGLILKTINGGVDWTTQSSPTGQALYSVYFVDAATGYAVGKNAIVLKTTDGGTTWTIQSIGMTGSLINVFFIDMNTGYAAGSDLWGAYLIQKTTDGGVTWTQQFYDGTVPIESIYFTDATTGYAVGGNGGWVDMGYSYGTILKTTDGGTTWTRQEQEMLYRFYSVYFTNVNTGYAAGDYGAIFKTTDGGSHWIDQTSLTTNDLNSVCFTDSLTAYVVGGDYIGTRGIILKTTNGGTGWTIQRTDTGYTLNSVFFCNSNIGYAVGKNALFHGAVLKTINGGDSWTILPTGEINGLRSVYFTDEYTGFAVGYYGTILKTTNGGIDWLLYLAGTNYLLYSVFFPAADTGYVVGGYISNSEGIILKTTDGGTNWTIQPTTSDILYSVYFTSTDTGYAVGRRGAIVRTTNGGATWSNIISGSSDDLLSVYFPTRTTGYIAGGTILKTQNAGINWTKLNSKYVGGNSVYFTNANKGYIIGAGGKMIKTTVGGGGYPIPKTLPATDITLTSASLNATVNPDGYLTTYYFKWGTTNSYGNNTLINEAGEGSNMVSVNEAISGLQSMVTYHYRIYATNSVGSVAGNDMTFTPGVAGVSTNTHHYPELTSAISGGVVDFDGGSPVTERGVCWDYSPNPTIDENHTCDGPGTGSFTSIITGLAPNTFYNVRAYATNGTGTYYGKNSCFSTLCDHGYSLPFIEDFDSTSIPPCWSQIDYQGNGQIWKFGTVDISYDNGPLINSKGTGTNGADESVVVAPLTYSGFNFTSPQYSIADDFTITRGQWAINSVDFFGYQTGSGTTSTFTGVFVRVWNSNPWTVGSAVIWGDLTTNRIAGTSYTNINRTTAVNGGPDRPIMKITANTTGLLLNQGTYWIEWGTTGTLASGPWCPPVTVKNVNTTGYALQRNGTSWQSVTSGGYAQGMPFKINGIPLPHPSLLGNYACLNSNAYGAGYTQYACLVTPPLDMTPYLYITLRFKHCFMESAYADGTISYSIDDGLTWTPLQVFTTTTADPGAFVMDVSAVAGLSNVKFSWAYYGRYGYYWAIDDVQITGVSAEQELKNITIGSGTTNCYNAGQTISVAGSGTTFSVQDGGDATLIAGHNIQLLYGTTIEPGGHLWGYITTSGDYCTNPASLVAAPVNAETIDIEHPGETPTFRIYPNPTAGKFTLELNSTEKTPGLISIYGSMGNKIQDMELTPLKYHEFSLENKPTGIYLIKVVIGNQAATEKIIKQ